MEKIVLFEKGSLCYAIEGQGSAVVLLHGFLEDHHIWDSFAEKLSKNHTVISIDLPGFGQSSVFNETHSMTFMANAVYYVLIEENISNCVMVGHSMGGYVTLAFADLYPDKLTGIVLFHSQAGSDNEEGKLNRDRTIKIIKSDRLGFINSFIPSLFAEKNKNKYEDEINLLRKKANNISPDGVIAALAGMRDRNDQSELLKKIELPVLFIIGKQDSRIPLEVIIPQLSLAANCEAVILDGVGHMGFFESNDLTFKAVEHFVERNA
jgi:pimeloyl-ACP methyl ester carboxylesterase